ncbi:MAG: hypothetical protein JO108_19015 [Acidobacteriaceae bacterium]|nr:hypothetical protein [Acidobacteriaceae bacterium]
MSTQDNPSQDELALKLKLEAYKLDLEVRKVVFDYAKHVTTLASGLIVILATFLEKLLSSWRFRPWVFTSFGFLVCSIMMIVLFMLGVTAQIANFNAAAGAEKESALKSTKNLFVMGLWSFLIGIFTLAVYVVLNVGLNPRI